MEKWKLKQKHQGTAADAGGGIPLYDDEAWTTDHGTTHATRTTQVPLAAAGCC